MDPHQQISDSPDNQPALHGSAGQAETAVKDNHYRLTTDLTPIITTLIDNYVSGIEEGKKGTTPIHVDEIASRLAKFYELIRKVVDWKEDNALRRSAIERILKRLLFTKLSGFSFIGEVEAGRLAEAVTFDLIRGGHLPNDEVPQERVEVLKSALGKYIYLLEHTSLSGSDPTVIKRRVNFFTFIVELAACETEEILTNPLRETGLIYTMTAAMNERIRLLPNDAMSADEKFVQVFIAVCRTLFDLDDAFITYHLLAFQFSDWQNPSPSQTELINREILSIWDQSEEILKHPLAKQFYGFCERIDTVFVLLGDLLDEYKEKPEELLSIAQNRELLTNHIEKYYDARYTTLKRRLFSLAVFSTLSVFLSNWFTFYIVEVPLAKLFYEGFNWLTAFIDFLVPTAVMFFLVSIIRPPGNDNKKRVVKAVYSFVYTREKYDYYEVNARKRRRRLIDLVIGIVYLAIRLAVFAGIAYVFYFFRLPITSVIFDTLTIALTVYASVTIRNKSKELSVNERLSLWEFFLDMISVPVAKIGSILAAKWKEYNVVAFLFNFIIETPFAVILDVIEQWSNFLKERRAELH
jgi:hypothetical protein